MSLNQQLQSILLNVIQGGRKYDQAHNLQKKAIIKRINDQEFGEESGKKWGMGEENGERQDHPILSALRLLSLALPFFKFDGMTFQEHHIGGAHCQQKMKFNNINHLLEEKR